jgi:hypothetical protein
MTQALAPKIGAPTVQSRSHRRLAAFVDWISPEPDTREAIRTQAADIRRESRENPSGIRAGPQLRQAPRRR